MPCDRSIVIKTLFALCVSLFTIPCLVFSQSVFKEVSEAQGVKVRHRHTDIHPSFGTGATWFDCDGDGDLDLFIANRGANSLFRNNRIGLGTDDFTDITTPVIADAGRDGSGAAAADYDNDGDMDLFLTNYEDDMLLENDGAGNFTDVTSIAFPGISPFIPQFGSSAAWGDLNNDGWLDLYISNYDHIDSTIAPSDFLFISNGGYPVTFQNRSDLLSGDVDEDGIDDLNGFGLAAILTDVNNDGWLDIFATNDCPLGPEGNKLWINNGDMTFTESISTIGPFTRGITTPECFDVMGITRGDPNHDGWLDYHLTNVHIYGENTVFLQNNGENLLNVSGPAGLDMVNFTPENGLLFTWGTSFIDYDLDTWQDIAFAGGSLRDVYQPNFLFHNPGTPVGGTPRFEQVDRTLSGLVNGASTRTMIMADYDMDGDPDLFTINFNDYSSLYRNENDNGNNWLIIELKGAGAPLSNANGIGAKIRLITPDNAAQFYEVYSGSSLGGGDDIAAYFGLAGFDQCDIEITWPSGIRQIIRNQQANARIKIDEPAAWVQVADGASILDQGNTYSIRWKSPFTEDVIIVLTQPGFEDVIISESVINNGNFLWTVPENLTPGQNYNIQVINSANSAEYGTSLPFSVLPPDDRFAILTSPSGGELIEQSQKFEITWESSGAGGNVSLNLYSGDVFIGEITSDLPDSGSYEWNVADTLEGNNFFIEITGSNGYSDRNPHPFVILEKRLEFNVPNLPVLDGDHSHARIWMEMLLEAIRNDFARPTVHARNLFHTAAAMYDAWAVIDPEARPYFLGNTVHGFFFPFDGFPAQINTKRSQEEAISFAAYRLMKHRFANSPGAPDILEQMDILFNYLGYDRTNTSTNYQDGSPAALGNYIAEKIIEYGLQDGSNEANDYANEYYAPVNPPLYALQPGTGDIQNPNRWQPLAFDTFIDQSGHELPGGVPEFLSPEWGKVLPFSMTEQDLTIGERDGSEYWIYHDPGPPAFLEEDGGGDSDMYKWGFELVSAWSAHLDPYDGVTWDISPASTGNIQSYPSSLTEYADFYDLESGGDPGQGYDFNPVTGEPYEPQLVPRGDYTRVLAEFWADGPDSETPPGHWFTILNYVNDHPDLEKRFNGEGKILQDLEWDIKSYFILGGAMHDVAVSSWGIKGYYDYIRPISAIRYMASLGQSSNPDLPSYHPEGIELIPGFIELIENGDPLSGANNENTGKIKVKAWRGHDYITDPGVDEAGVDWILAESWVPYQRPSFVTPPFAGYVSGHSTYSRAGAEILTALTGSKFFPGGQSEFVAPKNNFLVFERGPSTDIILQWATYYDAADQCSLSRIWGGIHPPMDDLPGRKIGAVIGKEAFDFASSFFEEAEEVVVSNEPVIETRNIIFPNPLDKDILSIRLDNYPETYEVSIYDLTGALILNTSVQAKNTEAQLDLSKLRKGLYILILSNSDHEIIHKLIRE